MDPPEPKLKRSKSFYRKDKKLKNTEPTELEPSKRIKFSKKKMHEFHKYIRQGDIKSVTATLETNRELLEIPRKKNLYPLGIALEKRQEKIAILFISQKANLSSVNVVLRNPGPNAYVEVRSMLGLAYDNALFKIAELLIESHAVLLDHEKDIFQEVHNLCLQNIAKRQTKMQTNLNKDFFERN